ncbi:acyl-CoA dehydrogenase [Afifella pfennigii]|uniref:acyl-CoA dehydrogenase n=1 Tax=Afifella pfennigii TaxID=209897 RepID=UPI000550931E|nr:acyl-CoA dehydrogenase [Afifella pfennigii]
MYRAPVAEIAFTLKHVTGFSQALAGGHFGDLSEDLVEAILEEAGRFAAEEIAPLNEVGDRQPARYENGAVTMPAGWKDAYRKWCEGGWAGLSAPAEFGGQGLPLTLQVAAFDIWNGASLAFALGPTLTVGAVEALDLHASEELKRLYLEKLATGEWMGTMNLTEPQAGTDLGALRCRAERGENGTYRIAGQKIFITYGEHDLTENIVHTVLARLPDAPAGTKGISLFLVPKYLAKEDGTLGARNDVFAASIEHKLGIHASPTCVMLYGDGRAGPAGEEKGAVGYLIGEENRGLHAMFTMMNNARLMVGIEGVGVAERALQQATAYAQERRQGRAAGKDGGEMSPIIAHPDIRRTLLAMHGLTAASRAICYACAHALDMGKVGAPAPQGGKDGFWGERAALLTPVAKAFSTDAGVKVASAGIQVHGGMGYIEETGAAQHLRDARITPIYEGTNGVQAIDLVTRKLPLSDGETVRRYLKELGEIAEAARASNRPELGSMGEAVSASLEDCAAASEHLIGELSAGRVEAALAGATPFLELFGLAAGGAYLAKGALATEADGSAAGQLRVQVARGFAERLGRQTQGLRQEVVEGAGAVLETSPELLAAAS